MKTTTRFVLLFLGLMAAAFYYLTDLVINDIRPGYLRALEESANDIAHILATEVENDIKDSEISTARLEQIMQNVYDRRFNARIYELLKTTVNLRVYVTDARGIVLYDSFYNENTGKDFSLWNDVYLTLKGQYGARSSRIIESSEASSSIFVGAPIYHKEKIAGVLTVMKPKVSVNPFIESATRRITIAGIVAAVALSVFTILIFLYISNPLNRLTLWVTKIRQKERVPLPRLGNNEIALLGETIQNMRQEIDGRRHVENTIRTLAHELKSPLTSARSATEILGSDINDSQRKQFAARLDHEITRLERIIDEISTLSRLEAMASLENKQHTDLLELFKETAAEFETILVQKKLQVQYHSGSATLSVNRWLIRQVFVHLLTNAIEFADTGSAIEIKIQNHSHELIIDITNKSEPVPDYALNKVFDQFFSLPRPETGEKSSGLGLAICKEIIQLHGGSITLQNIENDRVKVSLVLPTGESKKKTDNFILFSY